MNPQFSIIIPTHNRPASLLNTLRSLEQLSYPASDFEVIAVEDGGQRYASSIDEKHSFPFRFRPLRLPINHGPAFARNFGAKEAHCEYLVFIDDDVRPSTHWLRELAKAVRANPGTVIGGKMVNGVESSCYSEASQALVDFLYARWNDDPANCRFFTSNNFCITKELFVSSGGFDVRFPLAAAEDREFCDRLLFQHAKLVYAPEAIAYHWHHLDLLTFLKQQFNYGRGAYSYRKYRKNPYELRTSAAFYLALLLFPASPITKILFFVSQLAGAVGYLRQGQEELTLTAQQKPLT